ncbi:MAG: TlpA family protein disulfide reductase [Thermoplasmata archaeon]
MKRTALVAVILLAMGLTLLFLSDFYISEGAASDFTLVDIDGYPFTLSEHRGKVVLVEFMTTTCEVCKAEMEILKTIRQSYDESDLVIVSMSISPADNDSLLRDYRETHQANWTFLMDTANVRYTYRVSNVPHMYFIDGKGRIASSNLGYLDTEQVSSRIEQAISLTGPMPTLFLPIFSLSLVGIAFGVFLYLGFVNREQIKKQLFGNSGDS